MCLIFFHSFIKKYCVAVIKANSILPGIEKPRVPIQGCVGADTTVLRKHLDTLFCEKERIKHREATRSKVMPGLVAMC